MNIWLFFAFLAPVCWGIANVLDSGIRRAHIQNDIVMTWFFALARLPFVAVFLLLPAFAFEPLHRSLLMIAIGFLWMIPFVLYCKAMECEEPSRVVLLLLAFISIFGLLLAAVVLDERLTMRESIAFLLLFLSSICAATKKLKGIWHLSKAFWMAMGASFLWALGDVLFKWHAAAFENFFSAMTLFLIGGALLSIVVPLFLRPGVIKQTAQNLRRRGWMLLGVSTFLGTLGAIAAAYALRFGKASLSMVIFQSIQPMAVFLFGLLLAPFLMEIFREDLKKEALQFKIASLLLVVLGLLFV